MKRVFFDALIMGTLFFADRQATIARAGDTR
jgi:hypothetical protein